MGTLFSGMSFDIYQGQDGRSASIFILQFPFTCKKPDSIQSLL